MKHISSISTGIALGSAGIAMMSVLAGCSSQEQQQVDTQNKFLVIEQQANGKYIIVEEMPTEGPSRAIIRERDANGHVTERFMDEAEMKTLAEQEYQKVQNGTSETVQEGGGDTGMGIGGTILAAAAGAMMGNMIANSLMNNKNFSKNSASANKSAYSRSNSRSSTSKRSSSTKKSFFGSSKKRSLSRSFGS
jgi:hypothetical protein